jgi:putative ABC transport system permease protein
MLLSYGDAERLSRHPAVARRAKTFTSRIALSAGGERVDSPVRFATHELFPMFELGFRFGGPWSDAAERDRQPVVVLDHGSNERLFGGGNSVGRSLAIDGRPFRVVGVLAAAPKRLRAFDFAIVNVPAVYLPFELYRELGARPDYLGAWSLPGSNAQELERSADSFVQLWVELPDARAQREYDAFIAAQAAQRRPHYAQRRPPVQSAASFIDESVPIGSGFLVFEVCAFVALLACCVNLSRLLIVKFQARAPELAVHRAFGATRGSVLAQYMVEVVLVTFAATALGLLIAYASLESINAIVPDRPSEFALGPTGVLLACAMGLGSGLLAGISPALRSGQTAPAVFLRSQ